MTHNSNNSNSIPSQPTQGKSFQPAIPRLQLFPRNRRLPSRYREQEAILLSQYLHGNNDIYIYLSQKEKLDLAISKILRAKGVIKTPGIPFEQSQQQEIDSLTTRGIFEFVQYDPTTMHNCRIFNTRMVNEIKGKATATPYEKSRLVVQAYNDDDKQEILTQSPTIQRVSQRLIVALAPSLRYMASIYLRDITQAYVQ